MCVCVTVFSVDCSATFHGNAVDSHTSCISEAQKYQGKMYQAPKPPRTNPSQVEKSDSKSVAVSGVKRSHSEPSCSSTTLLGDAFIKSIDFDFKKTISKILVR